MNITLFRLINDGIKCPVLDWVLPVFSDKAYVVLPGVVALGLLLYFGRRHARTCVLAMIFTLLLSDMGSEKVLKNLFGAKRPYATLEGVHLHRSGRWIEYDPTWYPFDGRKSNAFPSSHASNVAAVAVVLAFLYRGTLWAALPLAALVGFSRVYTGNHYPGDVLAGYAWGALCGFAMCRFSPWLVARVWGKSPAEEARPPLGREGRVFLWLLGGWTLFNFGYIHLSGFGLAGDEAQYWDWSRRLALGYYSKPPLIAYVHGLMVGVGGNTEWAIRSAAVLFSSGTMALVYALTVRMARRAGHAAPERTALFAALMALAMPLTWAGAVLTTPDALLTFFWALGLYAFHRAAHGETGYWWLLGFALGMGLLAKYTALFLPAALLVYLMLFNRAQFRTKGPYIAAGVMVLCMSGVLYWNWTNDWISFRHTASIGASKAMTAAGALGRLGEFVGGQAAVVSPVLFLLMLWAMAGCARRFRRDSDAALLVLAFTAVFGSYAVISLRNATQPNWAVCAYLASAPALALWWQNKPRAKAARRLLVGGMVLGCVCGVAVRSTGLVYLADAAFSAEDAREDRINLLGLEINPGKDPTNELKGGRELGAALSQYIGLGKTTGPFIFSDRYQLTAQAAFYTKGRPHAYCMNPGDRRLNQYDLWGGWDDLVGRDGLFVTGGEPFKAMLFIDAMVQRGAFESGELIETVEVRRGDTIVKTYTISRLKGYSGYDWTPEELKF
jgi:membrane-associated phospholipid phosphatase